MKNCVYTSFNYAYAVKASILARSIRKYNPDWKIVAIITDVRDDAKQELVDQFFDTTVFSRELPIKDYDSLLERYTVVEMCTAVKGEAALALLHKGYDNVFYFDPDIEIFSSLSALATELEQHNVSLTPHCLKPIANGLDHKVAVIETEVNALKYGLYNLGYIGFKNSDEGRQCAQWWADRLALACADNTAEGYFTDQKWCDHIPVFFKGVLVSRDFGRNVANWNLFERDITSDTEGHIYVNGDLLKFYHFTKFGPLGFMMTKKYARNNPIVFDLWKRYSDQLVELGSVRVDYTAPYIEKAE